MTEQDKQLLLIDLCARLPYGVKIDREWIAPMSGSPEHGVDEFSTFDIEVLSSWIDDEKGGLAMCDDGRNHWVRKYKCKPYLRPMSSMTEEERQEYEKTCFFSNEIGYINTLESYDWLNKHHFAYRTIDGKDMFELGLAIEAPKDMYNLNEK